MPDEFWRDEAMVAALASRHVGKVISAYRHHPHHGRRPLPQDLLGEWLGMKQSRVSRLENGPPEGRLDQLVHCARVLRIPSRYLWFTLPGEPVGVDAEPGVDNSALGPPSSARSAAVVAALDEELVASPSYAPPAGAVARLTAFASSSSRVFLLTGPPGSGKSRLTLHAVDVLAAEVDFQLHTVAVWDTEHVDVAAEVLRYASVSVVEDPLIVLEVLAGELRRPCLVVIDGIGSQEQLDGIGRSLEQLLRQVTCDRLKFVVVVRTPPDVDTSAFPLVAASTFRAPDRGERVSCELGVWSLAEARSVWSRCRASGDPAFVDLPRSLQELARLPLYMRLLRAAGVASPVTAINAYRLVEHCVRALAATGPHGDRDMDCLAALAVGAEPSAHLRDLAGAGTRPGELPTTAEVEDLASNRPSLLMGSTFRHDVIREFFVSQRLADVVQASGRSAATVSAFNDLALRASTSASARGVFEFLVSCIDGRDPDLLAYVTLSPTVAVGTTLPLLMRMAAAGCEFATGGIWRACARKAVSRDALSLCRELLASSAVASELSDEYASWALDLLREHGAAVWADVAGAVERDLDAEAARRVVEKANFRNASDAVFFARHVSLFVNGDDTNLLGVLLGHTDWRVRAALADGLQDQSPAVVARVVDRLARDGDYKVRSAVSRAIAARPSAVTPEFVRELLGDENWHVRAEALRHLTVGAASRGVVTAAVDLVTTEGTWRDPPGNVAVLMHRLLLSQGVHGPPEDRERQRALFTQLREMRTGWAPSPANTEDLLCEASESPNWLLRREHAALVSSPAGDPPSAQEWYRRLRERRAVQVALDVADLDRAVAVARAAVQAGAELVEVGDPLIKAAGMAAVEHVKREAPDATIVAEMMSADWGRDQVVLAAEAGADVAFLIGPASAASVAAAVSAGHRLGLPIVLDVHPAHLTPEWVRDMERAGVDGFAVTTNIDLGVAGDQPFSRARRLREWTRLPVAVSGGFSPDDPAPFAVTDWDILVVGRSVADAVDPGRAVRSLVARARRSTRSVEL